ncbi:hypothetical protein FOL47_005437 [Perkinsus chesapeaki]|uniref:EamA domain-containing protein n=1 Tax=Perkinsus chesapeaki TaxID=330153 RepID=A0A7J6MZT2_PERCH|nr:hypothetical protein FOL47_005437 [Perkinsus chesapeaki]
MTSHLFLKPGFVTTITFLGMLISSVAHGILMCFKSYRKAAKPIPIKLVFMVAIPAVCELTGSGLQNIALVYTPVSIFQILKGSVLIFSALFRRIFLRKKFSDSNWIGLCLCVFALIPVGISHILSKREPGRVGSAEIALGLGLVLAAQLIRGSQFVIEEYLLKPPHTLSPLVMIGVEGFWGTLLLVSFILPLLQHIPGSDAGGVMENTMDTFEMLHNSGLIMALCVGLLVAFFIYKVLHKLRPPPSFLLMAVPPPACGDRLLLYIDSANPRLRAPLCTREEMEAEIREQVLRECENGANWLRLSVLSKQERRQRLAELVRERTARLAAHGGLATLGSDDDSLASEIRAKYGTILSTSFRQFLATLPLHLPEALLVSSSVEVRLSSPPEGVLKYPKLGLINIRELIATIEASPYTPAAAAHQSTIFDLDSVYPQPGRDAGLLLLLHSETLGAMPQEPLASFACRCVEGCKLPVYVAVFGVDRTADEMGVMELLMAGLCLETCGWFAHCPLVGSPTFITADSAIGPIIRKEFTTMLLGLAAGEEGDGRSRPHGGRGQASEDIDEPYLIDLEASCPDDGIGSSDAATEGPICSIDQVPTMQMTEGVENTEKELPMAGGEEEEVPMAEEKEEVPIAEEEEQEEVPMAEEKEEEVPMAEEKEEVPIAEEEEEEVPMAEEKEEEVPMAEEKEEEVPMAEDEEEVPMAEEKDEEVPMAEEKEEVPMAEEEEVPMAEEEEVPMAEEEEVPMAEEEVPMAEEEETSKAEGSNSSVTVESDVEVVPGSSEVTRDWYPDRRCGTPPPPIGGELAAAAVLVEGTYIREPIDQHASSSTSLHTEGQLHHFTPTNPTSHQHYSIAAEPPPPTLTQAVAVSRGTDGGGEVWYGVEEYMIGTPPTDTWAELEDGFSSGVEAAALASAEYLAGVGSKLLSFAQQAVNAPQSHTVHPEPRTAISLGQNHCEERRMPGPLNTECRMETPGVFSRSRDSVGSSVSSSASSGRRSPRLVVIDGRQEDSGLTRPQSHRTGHSSRDDDLPSVPSSVASAEVAAEPVAFSAVNSSAILASAGDSGNTTGSWLSTVWEWVKDSEDGDPGSIPPPGTSATDSLIDTQRRLLTSAHIAVGIAERISRMDVTKAEAYALALAELTRAIGDLECFATPPQEEIEELLILLESVLMTGHYIAALTRSGGHPHGEGGGGGAHCQNAILVAQRARLRGVVARCREEFDGFTRRMKYSTCTAAAAAELLNSS